MSRQVVCFNTVEKVSTLCEFTDSFIDIYVSLLYCHVQCCTLGTRGFSRVRREFSVLAEGRHIFGRRPKPRAAFRAGHYKDLTETGNRARKVSGTQGTSAVVQNRMWGVSTPEGNAGEVWVEMYRRGEKCRLFRYPVQDKRPTRDLIQ